MMKFILVLKKLKLHYLALILVFIFISCNEKNIGLKKTDLKYSKIIIFQGHAVPDTFTAVSIAEIIWLANYGNGILNERPYVVNIIAKDDTIWNIQGTNHMSTDPNLITVGGLANI